MGFAATSSILPPNPVRRSVRRVPVGVSSASIMESAESGCGDSRSPNVRRPFRRGKQPEQTNRKPNARTHETCRTRRAPGAGCRRRFCLDVWGSVIINQPGKSGKLTKFIHRKLYSATSLHPRRGPYNRPGIQESSSEGRGTSAKVAGVFGVTPPNLPSRNSGNFGWFGDRKKIGSFSTVLRFRCAQRARVGDRGSLGLRGAACWGSVRGRNGVKSPANCRIFLTQRSVPVIFAQVFPSFPVFASEFRNL